MYVQNRNEPIYNIYKLEHLVLAPKREKKASSRKHGIHTVSTPMGIFLLNSFRENVKNQLLCNESYSSIE